MKMNCPLAMASDRQGSLTLRGKNPTDSAVNTSGRMARSQKVCISCPVMMLNRYAPLSFAVA